MCKGYAHMHAVCGHFHHYETTEMCRDFSHTQDSCYHPSNTLGTVSVPIPARCNNCFNSALADIRRNCNGLVATVQAQIAEIDFQAKGCSRSRGKTLSEERILHRQEITEFERKRDADIAELRVKQGV